AALEALGVPAATSLWGCAARLALRRGHFVAALTLARRHLQGEHLRDLLSEMAQRYGAGRVQGPRCPPPLPPPLEVQWPAPDAPRAAWIELSLKLGCDIAWLCPTAETPLPEIPLFGVLSPATFVLLAESLEEVPLRDGAHLLRQGARESDLYFLAQGRLRVERCQPDGARLKVAEVEAPALLGEMALLTALPHRADVIAVGPVIAWRVSAEVMLRSGAVQASLTEELSRLVKHRLLINLLQHSTLFEGLDDPEPLLNAFELRAYQPGLLFDAGEAAPGLFVLLHGQAEVWSRGPSAHAKDASERTRVAILSEGDVFGEISLLEGGETTASVQLIDGGVLLHLSPERFAALGPIAERFKATLSALGGVRRGELAQIQFAGDYADIDDSWLLEEV
ncbi:cyclic nucleotide-binding domain-containing protein, partial [Myxococcota bacterium]|nr:cyclic nucleotide-binding domain-containing protein [Myxococcota bacterium]